MKQSKLKYNHCPECKMDTPQSSEGYNMLGHKVRCRVCGSLLLRDGLEVHKLKEANSVNNTHRR